MTEHRAIHSNLCGPYLGVSAVVVREGRVLVGRRQGSHGAGTWAFPGGKVDPGEDPVDTVRRELQEETGLCASEIDPLLWTSDVLAEDGLQFITLHHHVRVDDGDPRVCEPDKVREWLWVPWDRVPQPLFAPAASLFATGWRPPERRRAGVVAGYRGTMADRAVPSDLWTAVQAEGYDDPEDPMFAPALLEATTGFLMDLTAAGRALEFAIGTGRVAVPLHAKGVEVCGIEYSEAMAAHLCRARRSRHLRPRDPACGVAPLHPDAGWSVPVRAS